MKSHAKELRKKGVLSEVLLWNQLKGKKMRGYQFMRQKPIGDYIVDFFCGKLGLVIEIDGESHDGRFRHDAKRQKFLESIGLTPKTFGAQIWRCRCEKGHDQCLNGDRELD